MCTRQRKWQRARSAEGKCELCAADAGSGTRCDSCRDKQRKRSRDRYRAAHGIPLDAPKHSTYGGKPRDLTEAEPVYRMLKTGETIQAGDVGRYRRKIVADPISEVLKTLKEISADSSQSSKKIEALIAKLETK